MDQNIPKWNCFIAKPSSGQRPRGLLLFVMAPGDDRSGEFYVYDRKRGNFWLLDLADGVFGGYSIAEMGRKIRDFRLLDLAENPARLATVPHS